MLSALFFLSGAILAVKGGTVCPPNEDLYPCRCMNIPQTKKLVHTIVSCHRLSDSDDLTGVFSTLRQMQIDRFYLYDSFWDADKLNAEHKQKLPSDWFTLLRIKEMEIVDSPLSSCFACENKLSCRNNVMTRFTARNSSASEKICTLCDTTRGDKYSWISCLSRLQHFHFSGGKLTALKKDFFPVQMDQLLILNLTRNQIQKIDAGAFANLRRLTSLDLSHNSLMVISKIFNGGAAKLEYLDLSWNILTVIPPELLPTVPVLKSLKLHNNQLNWLKDTDWKDVPNSLRDIDLRDNQLHCDCGIVWINGTLHINVVIQGVCSTPEEYENMPLRRASRNLGERCTPDGSIGTRPKKAATPSL